MTVLLILYPLLPLPRIVGADIAYAVPLTLVVEGADGKRESIEIKAPVKALADSPQPAHKH